MTSVSDTTSPRPVAQLAEQLAELVAVKEEAIRLTGKDFATQVALRSILQHEQELRDELRSAVLAELTSKAAPAKALRWRLAWKSAEEMLLPVSVLLILISKLSDRSEGPALVAAAFLVIVKIVLSGAYWLSAMEGKSGTIS